MSKFKPGDRVVFVRSIYRYSDKDLGKAGVVASVASDGGNLPIRVWFDGRGYSAGYAEEELEFEDINL